MAASYWYDPLGRRTYKLGTGVTQRYFLNDGDDEIAEYDGNKNVVALYVPGPAIDEPIAMVTPDGSGGWTHEFFHTNRQGSVIMMTNDSGGIVEGPFTYAPAGGCADSAGHACPTGEPYRFTGRRWDDETGLLYFRARYYSLGLGGRFMQTDPVGYTADMNLYTYVGNDPTNMTDPTGQVVLSLGGSAEAYYIVGTGGGVGLYYDTDTGQIGSYVTVEGGTGVGLSAGGSFGISKSMQTFQGWSSQVRVGAGPVTGQASASHLTQPPTSASVSAGVGIPFDFTISKAHTGASCWFFCGNTQDKGQPGSKNNNGRQPAPGTKGKPVSETDPSRNPARTASSAQNGSGRSSLYGQTVRAQGTRICPKDSSGDRPSTC